MIVFCGGIGENDALVRAEICSGLAWIGVSLSAERNRTATNPISNPSHCAVHILVSQEGEQIARHSWGLLPEFRC
jgi:acetate kinase